MRQFCTFYLGNEWFGIDVGKVQEVIRVQETTEVPLAPGVIRGLINLRGSIVSCVDLRLRFGMPAAPDETEPVNVIVQNNGGLISFQADRVGDVAETAAANPDPRPATLKGPVRRLIDGVHKIDDSLLQIVNVEQVMEFDAC